MKRFFPCLLLLLAAAPSLSAEVPTVENAVQRGLALVVRAGTNWQKNKTCFSCHHQTLPMLSMMEAGRIGIALDQTWFQSQAETTHDYFQARIGDMNAGEHVPGGATTVGYGFWALEMAQRPADPTTEAMVNYLLKIQGVARLQGRAPTDLARIENGRWTTSCRRPPMQGSDVADTVLTLIGMKRYATAAHQEQVAKATSAAGRWLAQASLNRQEDRIWRLWGLHHLGGEEALRQTVRDSIFKAQQSDGGWPQADALASDAFSTGQTLFVLCQTGVVAGDPAIQRARDYLLRTQLADGSWLVDSRVEKKVQPYFENGDPHGEHQFLSTAAIAWSVAGLAQLLPPTTLPKQP